MLAVEVVVAAEGGGVSLVVASVEAVYNLLTSFSDSLMNSVYAAVSSTSKAIGVPVIYYNVYSIYSTVYIVLC